MPENKELLKTKFACGSTPNADDFASLIDGSVGLLTDVVQLPPPSESVLNSCYKISDTFYTCKQNPDLTFFWEPSVVGAGVKSYNDLENKPKINGVVLSGEKTGKDLKLLNDSGGYTIVRPEPSDALYLARNGKPFVSRVSDFMLSISEKEVETLVDITPNPPVITDAVIGETKYFNTTDALIYIADSPSSWEPQGREANPNVIYINDSSNVLARYKDNAMIDVSGGGGSGNASKWFGGNGTPNNSLGMTGDWYINTDTSDVYEKTNATVWTYRINIKGSAGSDAYTLVLSSDAHVFPAGTTNALAGSVLVNVIAYKGSTQIAATINSILGQAAGLTTSVSNNSTIDTSFTVTASTELNTRSGVLTVMVTVDGKSFIKRFSWSLALAGASGGTGLPEVQAPYDYLAVDQYSSAKWFPGIVSYHAFPEGQVIESYAKKYVIQCDGSFPELKLSFRSLDDVFLTYMQDMTIAVQNYGTEDMIVSIDDTPYGNSDSFTRMEWRSEKEGIRLASGGTVEIVLTPYLLSEPDQSIRVIARVLDQS